MAGKCQKPQVLNLIEKSPKKPYIRKKPKKNDPQNIPFRAMIPKFKRPEWMNREFSYSDFQPESGPCVGEILKCFIDEIESRLNRNLNVSSVYKCCSAYKNRASSLLESFIFQSHSYMEDDIRRIIMKESSGVIAAAILLYLDLFHPKPLHFSKQFLDQLLSSPLYSKDLIPNSNLKEIAIDIAIRQNVASVDTLTFIVAHINNILQCSTNPPLMQITLADIFGPLLISFGNRPVVEEMPEKKPESVVFLAILELCNIDFWRRLNKAINRGESDSAEMSDSQSYKEDDKDANKNNENETNEVNETTVKQDYKIPFGGDIKDKRTYENSYNMLWNDKFSGSDQIFNLPIQEKFKSQAMSNFFEVDKKSKAQKKKDDSKPEPVTKHSKKQNPLSHTRSTHYRFRGLVHEEIAADMMRRNSIRNKIPKLTTIGTTYPSKKNIEMNSNQQNAHPKSLYFDKTPVLVGFKNQEVQTFPKVKTSMPKLSTEKNYKPRNLSATSNNNTKNKTFNRKEDCYLESSKTKTNCKNLISDCMWTIPLGKPINVK